MKELKAHFCGGGNTKLGPTMGTFSVLKGNDPIYIKDLDCFVIGSCGEHCKYCSNACYVNPSYRYDTVKFCHAINTLALRHDIEKAFADLDGQLSRKRKPFTYIRLNQSGEIENAEQFNMWIKLAAKHPETTFFIYTKAYDVVIPALLSGSVPHNLIVLISIWHEQGIEEYNLVKHLPNVKAFVYDDGTFDYSAHGLIIQTSCKAYATGKLNKDITCERCRKCCDYSKNHKIIVSKAH